MPITRRKFLKNAGRLSAGILTGGISSLAAGCYNDLFQYSIHQTTSEYSDRKLNDENAALIEQLYNDPDKDFTFAFVTDSHTSYDELDTALSIISANSDISFVIHGGDLADTGLVFQYNVTCEILDELHIPFITVMGNHDTLGNGVKIFNDIFGPTDFGFTCNDVFFLIGNDNNWETATEDINFYKNLLADHQHERYRIAVSHIPPTAGSRFSADLINEYKEMCVDYGVDFSLHGHTHSYNFIENFTTNTSMLVGDAILHHCFYLIHVKNNGIEFETVTF